MVNFTPVNSSQVNSNEIISVSEGSTARISVNGFSLCSDSFKVLDGSNWLDVGNIDIVTEDKPQADGQFIFEQFIRNKSITFPVYIIADSKEDLYNKIDEAKKNLTKNNVVLRILVNDEFREMTVTASSVDNFDVLTRKRARFNLTLLGGVNPVFKAESKITKTYNALTQNISTVLNNPGARRVFGQYFFVINFASNLTSIKITVGGFFVQINQTFNAGDVLVVDSENQTVTVNQSEITDYLGISRLPIEEGNNIFSVEFTATSFSLDFNVLYDKVYL